MIADFRLPYGGLIDRTVAVPFTFNGRRLLGYRGDTLASALLANGVHRVATSIIYGRPRGITTAGADEPSALVRVEQPFAEPGLPAPAVELCDGLVARGLNGSGRHPEPADPARGGTEHLHGDVLVLGAGPAGLVAALTAARSGARVVLVDDQPRAGGSLLGSEEFFDCGAALRWVDEVAAELEGCPHVRVLHRATVFDANEDGVVLAVQRLTESPEAGAPGVGARHRVWRIHAAQTVVATGARERPLAFPDNDRPGIMLAGAARTYLHRYAVRPGDRALVLTTNDSAYTPAIELTESGVDVVTVLDTRTTPPPHLAAECAARGIKVWAGSAVSGTEGTERLTDVHVTCTGAGPVGGSWTVPCDTLLVSGGWNPALHLFSKAGGSLRYAPGIGADVPGDAPPNLQVAGSATGALDFSDCVTQGRAAGRSATVAAGFTPAGAVPLPYSDARPEETPPAVMWMIADEQAGGRSVAGAGKYRPDTRFVDLRRDATVSDVLRAAGGDGSS
ncbi:FAD/NAD(P)-binding oxidoreductase [Haloechinothrix sp. LS1_15]|uniref:FAD/NAD(P)-binding oxidoreductase n=1 Tax=Haloechinothrix sp. LS1_15 TaxID=2652248 RepID=UPI0029451663|nr:FAD/NAD(P)-binding oxidoreductase [Haloechinothrix sp. LS1_15]MDV6011834.1 FAD-dependent oxidoreductase [Haloechinothrix sp. LS1_15]